MSHRKWYSLLYIAYYVLDFLWHSLCLECGYQARIDDNIKPEFLTLNIGKSIHWVSLERGVVLHFNDEAVLVASKIELFRWVERYVVSWCGETSSLLVVGKRATDVVIWMELCQG